MNKKALFIIVIFFLIIIFIFLKKDKKENMLADNIVIIEEEIKEKTIETSLREEKTTPNTILILKNEYTDCGHEIINKSTIPFEMVNLTKNEIIKYYPNWDMESFSKKEIILSRKINSFCGEHYLLKEEN